MGSFRFRRSIKLGPGVRLNVSKTGIGASVGVRGARRSFHSSGRETTSVGIPGTGLGYVETRSSGRRRTAAPAEPAAKPGLFAGLTHNTLPLTRARALCLPATSKPKRRGPTYWRAPSVRPCECKEEGPQTRAFSPLANVLEGR
jgi:Protein of unknown function (DUF4236)